VLGALDDGVVALDAEGRLLLANAAARELLELDDTAAGEPLLDFVRLPAVHEAVGVALHGELFERDAELPGPVSRSLRVRAAPQPSGGVLLVLTDRTRVSRLERVRRDFVANVSHELRTPVSVIKASAETLLDGAIDDAEAARSFVEAIERNADRLGALVADLLDLSRIESGRQVLVRRAIDAVQAVRDAMVSLEPAAAAAGVRFAVEAEAEGQFSVHADAQATEQILVNLLHNALKHSPEGGVVRVRVAEAGDLVRFEVLDEGPGIPLDQIPRLFERFYRVDVGRARGQGGTGLGLAITKHLTQAMGGSVDVRVPAAEDGVGTCFWFTLPAHRSVLADGAAFAAAADAGGDADASDDDIDADSDAETSGAFPASTEPEFLASGEAAILALGPGVQELRRRLLRMAGRVEEMIGAAVRAVLSRDAELAARTILSDRAVNRDELEADELCLELLAAGPGSPSELRFVTRAAKMVTDLERIADLAVNICERAEPLAKIGRPRDDVSIERMAAIVQAMVRDVMDAFVAADVPAARAVIARDDEVDDLYHALSRRLIAHMASDARLVEGAIHLQAVAKFLERIGDHATNLGEQVIFMARGDDVRHSGKRDAPHPSPVAGDAAMTRGHGPRA
jgi:two-component system phosphate regulon sensor histidine kinase PhoR